MNNGFLLISLDFEMYWGVHDVLEYSDYKKNLDNVPLVIDSLLSLFEEYGIHCTWATVGLLFFNNRAEMLSNLPSIKPQYHQNRFSPYENIERIFNQNVDHVLFVPELIRKIKSYPFQELATHTFSHYYCLEEGQTVHEFQIDIKKAKEIASKNGINLKTIVFPRNQFREDYINVCWQEGLIAYRGNEKSWIYKSSKGNEQGSLKRCLRLLDSYMNVSGHHTYRLESNRGEKILNLPASRYLRPYSKEMPFLEIFKMGRIKKDLTYAAKNNQVYHLWWHPHNFGSNMNENLSQLREILDLYSKLNRNYKMKSLNMMELSNLSINNAE
jgi:hypothetical protein